MSFKFENGDEVKDGVSGYKGIIRARADYLTGCNRYGVQGQKMKDNKPCEWVWFDEMELTLIKSKKVSYSKMNTGGPLPENQYPTK